jgi:uncharacterized ferritin-like protein (DUF455 family)
MSTLPSPPFDGAGLHAAAAACIACALPVDKFAAVEALATAWHDGKLVVDGDSAPVHAFDVPGRPARPRLVHPRELSQRGLGTPAGRAALVHAVAHIEFNAVNLALDAVHRFRGLPREYYDDWIGVAIDEARHYRMLAARLAELGHAYGDFDAHDGLWDMALRTRDDFVARMALVPRVLEARGLDVTPGMIERLRAAGDAATADVLVVILDEEVAHVAAGTRWYQYACALRGLEPEAHFLSLVRTHAAGAVRGPHNRSARLRAGFSGDELDALAGLSSVG